MLLLVMISIVNCCMLLDRMVVDNGVQRYLRTRDSRVLWSLIRDLVNSFKADPIVFYRGDRVEINLIFGFAFTYTQMSAHDEYNRSLLHIRFLIIDIYIHGKKHHDDVYEFEDDEEEYGFMPYFSDGQHCILLYWGTKCYTLEMPWALDHWKNGQLTSDLKTWLPAVDYEHNPKMYPKHLYSTYVDFTYTPKHGEVQKRTVFINIRRMQWRFRKPLRWIIPYRYTNDTLELNYLEETGERVGEWKGGRIAESIPFVKGEDPIVTFKKYISTATLD